MIENNNGRASSGKIFQPRNFGTQGHKDKYLRESAEKGAENAAPECELWQSDQVRAPYFSDGFRRRRWLIQHTPPDILLAISQRDETSPDLHFSDVRYVFLPL